MEKEIKEIFLSHKDLLGKEIIVYGWVKTSRSSKDFAFLELNDGTFFKNLQVVFNNDLENFSKIEKIFIGSSLKIVGELVASPGAKQPFELKAKKIEVIDEALESFPLQKKRHSFEFLRTIAHLRARTNTFNAVFRVRGMLIYAIHKFFNERGFINIHTPIITGNDCEGAGEMFKVTSLDLNNLPKENNKIDYKKDFFGKEAGLTVSGQLEAETMAMAFRKVYTFGPTFRAENSNTKRHLAEFWMIEPEIAFADLNDDIKLAEEMMKYIVKYVLDNAKEEMEFFNTFIDNALLERLNNLVNSEFARITYTEAIKLLQESNKKFEFEVGWGIDIQTEHEKYLAEEVFKKPVFVTDYPKEIKAFYMRMNDDNKTVAATDLLAPGIGEIIGGSQREDRLDYLEKRMDEMNISKEELDWYLDLRRFGGVPHSGFGLGFERLVMYVTGMENIRDVIPFPRTPNNLQF